MKAIGYIRVSTDEQAKEGISLEAQTQEILSYCQIHNMTLVGIYGDPGISGKSLHNRPGIQSIMHLIDRKRTDCIIALDMSRLSRDSHDMLNLRKLANKKKVSLHFIKDTIVTSHDEEAVDPLVFEMKAVFNGVTRRQIAMHTRTALKRKKERGEKLGGRVPWGYREVEIGRTPEGKILWGLVEDHMGQAMIRRIVQLREGEHTIENIISILEQEEYRPRYGERISSATIRSILNRKED